MIEYYVLLEEFSAPIRIFKKQRRSQIRILNMGDRQAGHTNKFLDTGDNIKCFGRPKQLATSLLQLLANSDSKV